MLRDVYGEAQLIVTQGTEEGVRGLQIKIFKDREKYRKLPYLYTTLVRTDHVASLYMFC